MDDLYAPVRAELERWREEGRILPLWWRDDDATRPTPALERLVALARRFDAPLHLAVVPEPAGQALAARLASERSVFVLPHGWRHANHAPAGENKAEFGPHRPLDEMAGEAEAGWQRLRGLFGAQALPVFVPPWNRIDARLPDLLPEFGLRAVSTFKPRRKRLPAPGLLQVNTHLDPIAWRAPPCLREAPLIAGRLWADLAGRRLGAFDAAEPYGLLTHHLSHDEAIWDFLEWLLDLLTESGTVRWTPPLAEIS